MCNVSKEKERITPKSSTRKLASVPFSEGRGDQTSASSTGKGGSEGLEGDEVLTQEAPFAQNQKK